MNLNRIPKLLLVTVFAILLGCGGGEDPNLPQLGQVTGTISMDGEPLSGVSVTFTSEKGHASFGKTDSSGSYELTYRDNLKGAEVGAHTVTIETPLDAPPPPGYKDPIPAKYNTNTTLKVQVKEGNNPPIDFELTK